MYCSVSSLYHPSLIHNPYLWPSELKREGWDPINRFNSATFLCLSQMFTNYNNSHDYRRYNTPLLYHRLEDPAILSDCCFMPTQQFFSYIVARTSEFSMK
jgi:hypothetical protein